ncbi:MAG: hypothetical protein JXA52_01385 [Planctomycetes bacterium]|nr:hypothetical protein [Planctomycetota bacterium]
MRNKQRLRLPIIMLLYYLLCLGLIHGQDGEKVTIPEAVNKQLRDTLFDEKNLKVEKTTTTVQPLISQELPDAGQLLAAEELDKLKQQDWELFQEANKLFRQANEVAQQDSAKAQELYSRAVQRYELIVREGEIHNGKLYYNIGNAYFRMGDLGRAILNYRRAGRYLTGDENLFQNLKYARSLRADKIEEKQETKVLKTLLFWHYDFSSRTRTLTFAITFALFWLGMILRLVSAKAIPGWILVVVGVVALLFLSSLAYENLAAESNRAGVVVAEEVTGRKGDGETYQPSFKEPLHAGTEFTLVEKRGDWQQIELHDGRHCWIEAKAAELVW